MPLYFFNLKTDSGSVDDLFGTELPNVNAAIAAAKNLAHRLKDKRAMGNGPSYVFAIELFEQEGDMLEIITFQPQQCKILAFQTTISDISPHSKTLSSHSSGYVSDV